MGRGELSLSPWWLLLGAMPVLVTIGVMLWLLYARWSLHAGSRRKDTMFVMSCDDPTAYAVRHHLLPQGIEESAAAFRARIARTLSAQGHYLEAHEVLYQQRQSDNLFAYGPVDDGYGDAHIDVVAHLIQASVEAARRHAIRQQWPWYRRWMWYAWTWGLD